MATAQGSNLPVEQAWSAALSAFDKGSREIVLSKDTQRLLGDAGISTIVGRFESMIKAQASVLQDPAGSVLRILPPPTSHEAAQMGSPVSQASVSSNSPSFSSTSTEEASLLPERVANNSRAKVAKERMKKVPRPPNAFILYRQHYHPEVKAQYPAMHNNEISVFIGKKWRAEDALTQHAYKLKAEDLKRKHHEDHPDYQYQPRRAAEKKRRMTKAKKARAESTAHSGSATPSSGFDVRTQSSSPNHQNERENDIWLPTTLQNIPSFAISHDGQYLFHDLDTTQPSQLVMMAAQHNNNYPSAPRPNDQPLVHSIEFTSSAADEHTYDESMIDWQNMGTEAQAAHQQGLADFQAFKSKNTSQNVPTLHESRHISGGNLAASNDQHADAAGHRHDWIDEEIGDLPPHVHNYVWNQIHVADHNPATADHDSHAISTSVSAQGATQCNNPSPIAFDDNDFDPAPFDPHVPSQFMDPALLGHDSSDHSSIRNFGLDGYVQASNDDFTALGSSTDFGGIFANWTSYK